MGMAASCCGHFWLKKHVALMHLAKKKDGIMMKEDDLEIKLKQAHQDSSQKVKTCLAKLVFPQ